MVMNGFIYLTSFATINKNAFDLGTPYSMEGSSTSHNLQYLGGIDSPHNLSIYPLTLVAL